MPLTRRQAMAALAAPLLATAPPAAGQPLPGGAGLHARAMRKGLFYGAALDAHTFRADAATMAKVLVECGMITGDSVFAWNTLQPRPERFRYEPAEMLLAYAARHGLRARGRSLLAPTGTPPWVGGVPGGSSAGRLLETHVRTTAAHFRGRLAQWDVVNEPLALLASHGWGRLLGPAALDIAFHACAEADPAALRVLNEGDLFYATRAQEHRRTALLKLLEGMKARGVPVQALGLQAHLDAGEPRLNQRVLARFCETVGELGLAIVVTEMDVRDTALPADIALRDAAVAAHGRAFLDPVLASRMTRGVLTWGLSDRHSWIAEAHPRPDGLPPRPLPLDTALRRKRLWTAMAGAFDTAPERRHDPV